MEWQVLQIIIQICTVIIALCIIGLIYLKMKIKENTKKVNILIDSMEYDNDNEIYKSDSIIPFAMLFTLTKKQTKYTKISNKIIKIEWITISIELIWFGIFLISLYI